MMKRLMDLTLSGAGLLALAPVLLALAAWVKLDSPGPVFFRQERVGRAGVTFRIFKFRTMTVNAERQGPQITIGQDARITRLGHLLRDLKLDELPQLINVLLGDMSLVGPRPEVPRYVAMYPAEIRDIVLSVRPGITDLASIEFRRESELLGASSDPERTYVEEVMPIKLRYCVQYVSRMSLAGDLRIIVRTVMAIIGGRG